jgi:hypothetical protein
MNDERILSLLTLVRLNGSEEKSFPYKTWLKIAVGIVVLAGLFAFFRSDYYLALPRTYENPSNGASFAYTQRWRVSASSPDSVTLITVLPRQNRPFSTIPQAMIDVRQALDEDNWDALTHVTYLVTEMGGEILQVPRQLEHQQYDMAQAQIIAHLFSRTELTIRIIKSEERSAVFYMYQTGLPAYHQWDQELEAMLDSFKLD